MKNLHPIFISFLFIFILNKTYSQVDTTYKYYDLQNLECKKRKAKILVKTFTNTDGTYGVYTYTPEKLILKKEHYQTEKALIKEGYFAKYKTNLYTFNEDEPNVCIVTEGQYKNGKKDGVWKHYSKCGNLEDEIGYKNGVYHGVYKVGGIGEMRSEGVYDNGIKTGDWGYTSGLKVIEAGTYIDGVRNGEWIIRYGEKKGVGNLVDGIEDGEWKEYFEDGKIYRICNYSNGKFVGAWQTWFANGVLADSGMYNNESREIGEWVYRYENGGMIAKICYNCEDDLKSQYWNEDGEVIEFQEENYMAATYPESSESGMYMWISEHLEYPNEAIKNGISGIVYVSFIIDTDGTIRNVKIIKSPGESLSKEVFRLLKLMPNWKPAIINNIPFRQSLTLPIHFRLS